MVDCLAVKALISEKSQAEIAICRLWSGNTREDS
jgi:hypothetical protein